MTRATAAISTIHGLCTAHIMSKDFILNDMSYGWIVVDLSQDVGRLSKYLEYQCNMIGTLYWHNS
jgi:hypothetical protein